MTLTGQAPTQPFPVNLRARSPAPPHRGHVTILKLAGQQGPGGGGDFQVDSFFDVFFDISIDGGSTWIPQEDTNPISLTSSNIVPVPEPSTYALLGAALGLGTMRKRGQVA